MEWTRSDTLALASNSCTRCRGVGLRFGRRGKLHPCDCVLRSIFRACYVRFRQCVTKEKYISQVTMDPMPGRDNRQSWSRKDEEYIADFCLVTKRCLSEDDYRIFRYHYLLGADWKLCCRKLQIDRGLFFHTLYRLEAKLGKEYRELEPYALFPLDEYFHGAWRTAVAVQPTPKVVPIRGRLAFPRITNNRKAA